MKKPVYKYSDKNSRYARDYTFFTYYPDERGNIVYLASNSLGNLKKELKAVKRSYYYSIFTHYKEGAKKNDVVFVSVYTPRRVV
jgi:hypothetical protein